MSFGEFRHLVTCFFAGHDPVVVGTWDQVVVKCARCGKWL